MSKDSLVATGGKPMGEKEVRALIVGAETSRPSPAGLAILYETRNADGTLNGSFTHAQGMNAFAGTWTVDGDGQYCATTATVAGDTNASTRSCGYWYKLGADHFYVTGPLATKVTVKRP